MQRADDILFTSNVKTMTGVVPASNSYNQAVTWLDSSAVFGHTYYYRVRAEKPDADYWTPLIGPLAGPGQGTPTTLPSLVSQWSNSTVPSVAPAIQASPTSLTFATQAYLTQSGAQSFTVTSAGLANLLMSSISITGANAGDFSVSASTCPLTPSVLIPNGTCVISVKFRPTYANTRTATLIINSNDPLTPALGIPLTGNGGLVPLTITAGNATYVWTQTGLPTITVGSVVGLINGDTVAGLNITCASNYKAGGIPGTYPTSCTAGTEHQQRVYDYVCIGNIDVTPATATMISPVQGSQLTSTTVTFTWTSWGAAVRYAMYVGTTAGSANLANFNTTNTSATATNLPTTGGTIYVRLFSYINGGWQYIDYTYIAPQPLKSAMISPAPGSTLHAGTATFTWSAGVAVTRNALWIGTTLGATNLVNINPATSGYTATNLPKNNSTIYVRLYSMINSAWQSTDYTYIAAP